MLHCNLVAVELLRQKSSIFAADASSKNYGNFDTAQRAFNSVAVKERSKFERENVMDKWGEYSNTVSGATTAVITLIIAIDGDRTVLPNINSISDLEKALTQIASDVTLNNVLRSAEILWTPQHENDVMSRRDIFMDYPQLHIL